jgi:hypothetical protein
MANWLNKARFFADSKLREVIAAINREKERPVKTGTRELIFHLPERLVLKTRFLWSEKAVRLEAIVGRLCAADRPEIETVLHTYALRYNDTGDTIMDLINPFVSL